MLSRHPAKPRLRVHVTLCASRQHARQPTQMRDEHGHPPPKVFVRVSETLNQSCFLVSGQPQEPDDYRCERQREHGRPVNELPEDDHKDAGILQAVTAAVAGRTPDLRANPPPWSRRGRTAPFTPLFWARGWLKRPRWRSPVNRSPTNSETKSFSRHHHGRRGGVRLHSLAR